MTTKSKLDYLRIASWDDRQALELFAYLRRQHTGWQPSKWLQYKGHRKDGWFYGIGEQDNKRHYIADCSGPASNELYVGVGKSPRFYATRIDIQVTIPMPDEWEPFKAYADIKSLSKVKTSLVHSDTGSTIYIGARTGQKFARLYEKMLADDKYLRMEFEIKGRLANVLFLQLREGINIDTAFDHMLSKLKAPDYIKEYFAVETDGEIFLKASKIHDLDKQLEWLTSLENTIIKMGNDHYQGPTVKGLIERWGRLLDKQDIIL